MVVVKIKSNKTCTPRSCRLETQREYRNNHKFNSCTMSPRHGGPSGLRLQTSNATRE